jgi:serine/threonine-protein kinase
MNAIDFGSLCHASCAPRELCERGIDRNGDVLDVHECGARSTGFYCPVNASLPVLCPAGYACPTSGSAAPPVTCPATFFAPPQGAAACSVPAIFVSTFAGSTTSGFVNGVSSNAIFRMPYQAAVDNAGDVFVIDSLNYRVRRITAAGVVSTVAGSGTAGYADGYGASAQFNTEASGIAVNADGTVLYVGDSLNHRIRRVDVSTGLVSTLAGNGVAGWVDGGGMAAQFNRPGMLALDAQDNIYVAERNPGRRVRKITPFGVVTTVAGCSSAAWVDGVGTQACFVDPVGVAVDNNTLWVVDNGVSRIRRINFATAAVSTVAGGDGSILFADGIGSMARFSHPHGIAMSGDGIKVALIGDLANNRVRQLALASSEVTTFAGLGQNAYADGSGPSTAVSFQGPFGVTVDRAGTAVYVLSYDPAASNALYTSMVRKITSLASCPSGMFSVNATTCAPCPAAGWLCPAGAQHIWLPRRMCACLVCCDYAYGRENGCLTFTGY